MSKINGVSVKINGKKELKKMGAGLFLSVNAGSAFEPQMVHLTYTPKKVTKKTKHIALVGKGLTFDTGGYSLKPGGSMVNMKFDTPDQQPCLQLLERQHYWSFQLK